MTEPVFATISPSYGINLALVVSWSDAPDADPPTVTVTFAAGGVGQFGYEPHTEIYAGDRRQAFLIALGVYVSLPPETVTPSNQERP